MRLTHILTLITILSVSINTFAGRRIALGEGSAPPRTDVEIALSYSSDTGDASAMEIRIPLPQGITYRAGSAHAVSSRLDGHQTEASAKGAELVIVVYNLNLTPIPEGDGEIIRFSLNTGRQPGSFSLVPTVKLSDSSGRRLDCEAESGRLISLAPKVQIPAGQIDFGRAAIRGTYTRSFPISNVGTTDLHVSDISADDSTDVRFEPSQLTIAPGETQHINVVYSPIEYADSIAKQITVHSDACDGDATLGMKAVPYSVNVLSVKRSEGTSGEEAVITLGLDNMEPIAGVDLMLRLPAVLKYVEGSLEPCTRAAMLTPGARADENGTLRLILYGTAGKTIEGHEGDLLTFRVKINGQSGWYSLTPYDVKLANASGRNMTSGINGEYLVIKSAEINGNKSIDFGEIAMTESHSLGYGVSNRGQSDLIIDRVIFLGEGFSIAEQLPLTVAPGHAANLTIIAAPRERGDFGCVMNIYSNDPVNALMQVNVSGTAYSPNALVFEGEWTDPKQYRIDCRMTNHDPVAGLQADIVIDPDIAMTEESILFTDRLDGHQTTLAKTGEGRYRLIVYSMRNTPVIGNDGVLFSITVPDRKLSGQNVLFEAIRLSGTNGVNLTSPGASNRSLAVAEAPEEVVKGDLDRNGKINIADVTRAIGVVTHQFNAADYLLTGDMNGDGKINVVDVTAIIRIITNK